MDVWNWECLVWSMRQHTATQRIPSLCCSNSNHHYYVVLTQTILLESYFSEATRQQQPTQICCSAGYQMQAPRLKWEQETAGSWWGGRYPWPGHGTLAEEVQMYALLGWLKHQSPRCGTSPSSPLRNHCVRYLRNRWLHLSLVILESSDQVWILRSKLRKTFELSLINNYERQRKWLTCYCQQYLISTRMLIHERGDIIHLKCYTTWADIVRHILHHT